MTSKLESPCPMCNTISIRLVSMYDRTFPNKKRILTFRCENVRCNPRKRGWSSPGYNKHQWDVEKELLEIEGASSVGTELSVCEYS